MRMDQHNFIKQPFLRKSKANHSKAGATRRRAFKWRKHKQSGKTCMQSNYTALAHPHIGQVDGTRLPFLLRGELGRDRSCFTLHLH